MDLRKTSEDLLRPKCEGLDRGNGSRYRESHARVDPFCQMLMKVWTLLAPLRGIASHLQQQHSFPPNFSPAELLAGADARADPFKNRLLEVKSTRPDRSVL